MADYDFLKGITTYAGPGTFQSYGGWSLDTEFYHTLRSEYLLAHGIGIPVSDAKTTVTVPITGDYRVWVRTKNWVYQWKPNAAPGLFQLKINDKPLNTTFGNDGDWHWQNGGVVHLTDKTVTITLCDLTGFDGRCAGILLSADTEFTPPDDAAKTEQMINAILDRIPKKIDTMYDMVVCGGGIAGICTALSSAGNGLKTALIQDRSVVGGNNSSEVRVWLGGRCNFDPYPNIGNIVKKLEQQEECGYGEKNTAEIYEDERKLELLRNEKNIDLYMGYIVSDVRTRDNAITSVILYNTKTSELSELSGHLFTDSTGDGDPAFYAGADHEITINGHMGMTNMWNVRDTGTYREFPDCGEWAIDLSSCDFPGRGETKSIYGQQREMALGGWYWESGMELDPIKYAEYSRDLNLRAMYSVWHTLKNIDRDYQNHVINHSSYIGGKRESRRFLGDIILTKADIQKKRDFPDKCVPATWDFDVHYPDSRFYASFVEGDAFLSRDCHERFECPYFIPYRCLYSRNIKNLFFAGRNISVTHDALGSVRVMRTGGMMGEVIGKAAAICIKHKCTPREVYSRFLDEFTDRLKA